MEQKNKKFLLGVGITDSSLEEDLKYLLKFLKDSSRKGLIVTPNPEIVVYATKNSDFRDIINSAILALPDGVGIVWGSQMLGNVIKHRVTGVSFMEKVCEAVSKEPITVGFLGGREEIALKTAECLKEKYKGLKVAFALEEWPKSEAKSKELKCDILFVAFGYPRQEVWIANNLQTINVKVAMGVGGSFDFIAGKVKRAPKIVRDLGLEWLFRLIIQPWRIKRQTSLIYYVLLILKERLIS